MGCCNQPQKSRVAVRAPPSHPVPAFHRMRELQRTPRGSQPEIYRTELWSAVTGHKSRWLPGKGPERGRRVSQRRRVLGFQ